MKRTQPNPRYRSEDDLPPVHREHYEVARTLKGWFSPREFKDAYSRLYPERSRGSILPSDYCFNRENKGNPNHPRFLLWDEGRRYRFVGLTPSTEAKPDLAAKDSDRRSGIWALGANPNTYRIDAAVSELEEDTWSIGNADVRPGDKVAIWRYSGGSGQRGVVALGEVLTAPAVIGDPSNPYWVGSEGRHASRRVRVRYVVPQGLPLWLDQGPEVVEQLSIARASGGGTYRVTQGQWEALLQAAGGWPPAEARDVVVRDDTGTRLDARFFLEWLGDRLTLVVKARGGSAGTKSSLNSQYKEGLIHVLTRLGRLGASITDALVDSRRVRTMSPDDRRIPIDDLPRRVREGEAEELATQLGRGMAPIGREPGAQGAGNQTRRIRLYLEAPDSERRSISSLERELAGVPARTTHDEEPTADPEELDRRVGQLRELGSIARPSGNRSLRRGRGGGAGSFERDPLVKAWVLQEAAGVCELCQSRAPFERPNGQPYLEVHHLVTLAEGGPDTPENAVAACPNCHRALHYSADREALLKRLRDQVERLA